MTHLFWRRPVIHFYNPDADAVSLIVEGYREPWPMKNREAGRWALRLHLPYRDLNGRAYYFEVAKNGERFKIADPLAYRTERLGHQLISRFYYHSYKWQHPRFTVPPISDMVIYETHIPALSRHTTSKVQHDSHRGTYTGARSTAVLNHLQELGVAVEFLPIHASDKQLGQDWGYYSTSFNAMRDCYATNTDNINHEVMALVDAMHGRGIPVLLDVVFNHGGELLVKAWGEDIVYRKHENGEFCHGSGCGPTLHSEHPLIRKTIIDTLKHLVKDYRFDGFRFDLGALHDKTTMKEIHRCLPKDIYLIAEPWALGGTQWGKGDLSQDLSATRWAVWNDDFRESGKTFIVGLGDQHNRSRLMCAIKGSHINDGGWAQRPQQCINYLSSHDGKTLADHVGGDKRRLFLGIMLVLTSQGVPMLSEGTELMFSKQGEDNTYNRPDLNQINWDNARIHHDLVKAVAQLIALRKQLPHFKYQGRLRQHDEGSRRWDIDWIFPTGYPHHDNVNALGMVLRPPPRWFRWRGRKQTLVVLYNGSDRSADFNLPPGEWKIIVDGYQIAVNLDGFTGIKPAFGTYFLHPGTGIVLTAV